MGVVNQSVLSGLVPGGTGPGSAYLVGSTFAGANLYAASPAVQTYPLNTKTNFGFTINDVRGLRTSAGTVTFSIQINGTNVTGLTALTATTTPTDYSATAANVVTSGQRVTAVVSATSSGADLEFFLGVTR